MSSAQIALRSVSDLQDFTQFPVQKIAELYVDSKNLTF